MKKMISLSLALASFAASSFAMAGTVTHFVCKSEKALQGHTVTISFAMKDIAGASPAVDGKFKIVPKTDAVRALNTGDNNDVSTNARGVQIDADEIGEMHTTLFLYADHGYHTGYVSTSGESNDKLYSPISCTVN